MHGPGDIKQVEDDYMVFGHKSPNAKVTTFAIINRIGTDMDVKIDLTANEDQVCNPSCGKIFERANKGELQYLMQAAPDDQEEGGYCEQFTVKVREVKPKPAP